MTKFRVRQDITDGSSAYVNEVTRLHTFTINVGTIIEWMTTIMLRVDIEGSVKTNREYWLSTPEPSPFVIR